MNKIYLKLIMLFTVIFTVSINAQITTSSISGSVKDDKGVAIPFATVVAIHTPTGSNYVTTTRDDGSFNINGMKVGGPYTVKSLMTGFQPTAEENIFLQLAVPYKVKLNMKSTTTELQEVLIISKSENRLLSSDNKGASTNIGRRTLESLPTLSRSLTDFTKLSPQSKGTSFGGQDDRLNNLSIDGSIFNNNFGLQALPGSQTNSTPISLDAIEEIQVNLSPYNLRERDFTGAGINAVTRSGTNELSGSVFGNVRDRSIAGKRADTTDVSKSISNFSVQQFGFRLGGPIIKNKLFFFVNAEGERRTDPGTTFFANNSDGKTDNNETRVRASLLDSIRDFSTSKFGYDPGRYQGYDLKTYSNKILAKIDWSINDKHKLSARYSYLRSQRDVPVSSSGGFNGRRDNLFAMAFENSNYEINNDIQSFVAELNSNFSSRISNNLIIGYTANRDYRKEKGNPFPMIDILDGVATTSATSTSTRNLVSFGTDPFTTNNKLNTDNYQIQDNVTINLNKGHTVSLGANFDRFEFLNVFTPWINGQYAFQKLSDFYTSSNNYVNGTIDTTNIKRQVRKTYSNVAGVDVWEAKFVANQAGGYIQDQWYPMENFSLNYGVRLDVPFFTTTGAENADVAGYRFNNESDTNYKVSTSKLPKPQFLVNPRVGFNWDIKNNKSMVLRGGVGMFSARPAFVWISNQLSNNGVQNGEVFDQFPKKYSFNPNVGNIQPSSVSNPAATYNIAATDPNFKYPQVVKGNLAVDKKLVWNIIGTFEFNASKGINDVYYVNGNLENSKFNFKGPDGRPIYGGLTQDSGKVVSTSTSTVKPISDRDRALRINDRITSAIVLKSKSGSYYHSFTIKLERPIINGFGAMAAYNWSESKDFITAGSIAESSFNGNQTVDGNNFAPLAYSNNDQRHRFISNISFRKDFEKNFAFSMNLFCESRNQGRFSYVYNGDANGDGITGNDLIYIPKVNEVNFVANGTTTANEQKLAFESYVAQDKYLRENRGKYAERNGAVLPWVTRFDLSTMVEFFIKAGKENKTKHTLQLRADVFNVGNLINSYWGVGDIVNNNTLLTFSRLDKVTNLPTYTFNRSASGSLIYNTSRKSAFLNDVWQAQLGVRYYF
jgi:Carboxypeptidase regulatory-like domain